MMRSLFSGVAGLRTHQTKMDVIGNNIANVNTTAYKSQSVTFRDLMYQTTQKASGANEFVGGTNAKQIGLGVTTGAITASISSQGSAQTTNNPFDIMISGSAFFIVNNGQENFFTRDGSFYLDGQGNLAMKSNGYKVMGWALDPETGELDPNSVQPLKIMSEGNMKYEAAATTQGRISGIIDKNDSKVNSSTGRVVTAEFYDSMGFLYNAKYSIHGTKDDGSYYVQLDSIVDSNGKPVSDEIMNSVSFGNPTLNVEVAKLFNTVNATAVGAGGFTIGTGAGAVTGTIGAQETPPRAGVDDAKLAVLKEAYPGIDFSKVDKYTIDGNGTLKVASVLASPADDDLVGKEVKATGGKFASQNVVVTDKTTPGTTMTFTPGTLIDATVMNANDKATIKTLYGLDIDASGTTEFMVNQNGSLTVTKMNVKNAAKLEYNVSGSDPKGELLSANGNGEGKMTLSFAGQERFKDITLDFSGTSNVNNKGTSTVGYYGGDADNQGAGRTTGTLLEIGVSKDGTIKATYSNNMSKVLGQIAVTSFANASGLEKQGDNLYSATANSGAFDGVGKDITSEGGRLDSGVLEMSDVDLSAEFTEMITTQRGFQANSRIITVSDTMLEELTNLKR